MSAATVVDTRVGVSGSGYSTATDAARGDGEPAGRLERLPLLTQVGVRAALQALDGAGGGDDIALVVATRHGATQETARFLEGLSARGHAKADPFLFPNLLYNAVAGEIAIRAGIRGANVTVTAGGSCAVSALETSLLLLKTRRARRVLAVSVEAGGSVLGATYAPLRRRGLAGTTPLSRMVPFADDVASALLLSADGTGDVGVRRACTGYAVTEAAFAGFLARAAKGLDVAHLARLPEETPVVLGGLLSAARALPAGGCGLVVHRAEDGGCGAVAFER
jgi:hypothetical protein